MLVIFANLLVLVQSRDCFGSFDLAAFKCELDVFWGLSLECLESRTEFYTFLCFILFQPFGPFQTITLVQVQWNCSLVFC